MIKVSIQLSADSLHAVGRCGPHSKSLEKLGFFTLHIFPGER
jgi:hypothetical protein